LLSELVEHLLSTGVRVRLAVGGRSMAPRLRDGDVVIIEPLADTAVRFGELLLFRDAGGALVLHRVLRRWRGHLQTGGDASIRLDPAITREQVLGRVSRIERDDDIRIDLERGRERVRAVLVVGARLVCAGVYYKIIRRLAQKIAGAPPAARATGRYPRFQAP
jgi:hypothetical protein